MALSFKKPIQIVKKNKEKILSSNWKQSHAIPQDT